VSVSSTEQPLSNAAPRRLYVQAVIGPASSTDAVPRAWIQSPWVSRCTSSHREYRNSRRFCLQDRLPTISQKLPASHILTWLWGVRLFRSVDQPVICMPLGLSVQQASILSPFQVASLPSSKSGTWLGKGCGGQPIEFKCESWSHTHPDLFVDAFDHDQASWYRSSDSHWSVHHSLVALCKAELDPWLWVDVYDSPTSWGKHKRVYVTSCSDISKRFIE